MRPATQPVSELMRQPVVSVGPGASVQEVTELAESKGIHHIPIVQRGKLLGLVCTCDLQAAPPALPVLQLARRNVITAMPDCNAGDAARLMMTHVVGSLLIANGDGVWGIVTRSDLARSDAALAALLAPVHCAACKSRHHLQRGAGDTFLCAACAERANASHWFDDGGSD
ncbi:MAG TPA: CBS domain-containing protein [Polyangiaceae bacterium]|nr:CBS domain-containing protein [Polyangiaceae bacterium]